MISTLDRSVSDHPIVSRNQWLAERKKLLAREKELTRLGDQIARERRALPWVRMEKKCVFDTPAGRRPLADLFDGRHQLVMQHFMLAPGWEQGCKSCSYMADHTDATLVHLAHRDTAFVAVSRAPLAEIERFASAWVGLPWVSSDGTDFNHDFHVTFTADEMASGKADYNFGGKVHGAELPGVSAFWKDEVGRGLPHLLDLRARRGGDDAHLQPARPHAQGSRRGRAGLHHGLGAPPRPLRAGGVMATPGPLGAADCLSLLAAPTFAVMALLTAVLGGGPLAMLCSAGSDASPLTGMIPMYLLMSAFHTAPWLKLLSNRTHTSP